MLSSTNRLARLLSERRAEASEVVQAQVDECRESLSAAGIHDIDSLVDAVADRTLDDRIRSRAAWLIGWLKLRAATKSLLDALEHAQSPSVIWEAAKALCATSNETQNLQHLLTSAMDKQRRTAVVWALGMLGHCTAVEDLRRILDDRSEASLVRAHAAEALGNCGDRSASGSLIRALNDDLAEVRFWAAYALGRLREDRAIVALKQLADSDEATLVGWWSVGKEARDAISAIVQEKGE